MFKVNENYLKLPGSYLFSTIGKKVSAYQAANPDKQIIRLGIGDVTQPLAPVIIEAMHKAVDEMGHAETFHGYAPDLGYEFLRSAMAKNDYQDKGCDIQADEIFISDGAKCDSGNIQEIFAADSKIAVCDPVYPVYVDTNVMAGRTGTYDAKTETWSNVIYMPCTKETNFAPVLPEETPDIIYLCFPNNPTGSTITKAQLQEWVDYANRVGAVIIYDSAYEAYISESDVPHNHLRVRRSKNMRIELRSFSKNAGFTGVRLGANRYSKRSEIRRRDASFPVGKTSRNKIQRSTLHRTARRRSSYIPMQEKSVKDQVALLHEQCKDHQTRPGKTQDTTYPAVSMHHTSGWKYQKE